MARPVSNEQMTKYYVEAIDFMKDLINFHDTGITHTIDKDIMSISEIGMKYTFTDKDIKELRVILERSHNNIMIQLSDKADSLMLESFIARIGMKVDKDKADFETNSIDPFFLLKAFEKAQKKFMNKVKNDSIKNAIAQLESDNKEVTAQSIAAISNVAESDITKYLKRIDSVNKARENNPKVK